MPKQIKKQAMTKSEKANRVLAVIAMLITFVFGAGLIVMIRSLSEDDVSKWAACFALGGYVLFLIVALVHCVHGTRVFKKTEHYGILFQSILTGSAAFTALINLQCALAMFFSAIGKDSLSQKVVGDQTYDDFITSQKTSWILLTFGIAAVIVVGIAGTVKLIENAGRKRNS